MSIGLKDVLGSLAAAGASSAARKIGSEKRASQIAAPINVGRREELGSGRDTALLFERGEVALGVSDITYEGSEASEVSWDLP